jgi:hypothetical protein
LALLDRREGVYVKVPGFFLLRFKIFQQSVVSVLWLIENTVVAHDLKVSSPCSTG